MISGMQFAQILLNAGFLKYSPTLGEPKTQEVLFVFHCTHKIKNIEVWNNGILKYGIFFYRIIFTFLTPHATVFGCLQRLIIRQRIT